MVKVAVATLDFAQIRRVIKQYAVNIGLFDALKPEQRTLLSHSSLEAPMVARTQNQN